MPGFYGSPWGDAALGAGEGLAAVPSTFMRAQLIRQQIEEGRARERLYGAETEWNKARTEREQALAQQSKDDNFKAAISNQQFGSAVRRLFEGTTPAGPTREAAAAQNVGEIGAQLPGVAASSTPDSIAKAIQQLAILRSSGALTNQTAGLLLEGGRSPVLDNTSGWANILTGQTGTFPQGPADPMKQQLQQSQIDVNQARAAQIKAGKTPSDAPAMRLWGETYLAAFKDSGDPDTAAQTANDALSEWLATVGKPKPDEVSTNDNQAPQKPAPGPNEDKPAGTASRLEGVQGQKGGKKVRKYNPATGQLE